MRLNRLRKEKIQTSTYCNSPDSHQVKQTNNEWINFVRCTKGDTQHRCISLSLGMVSNLTGVAVRDAK